MGFTDFSFLFFIMPIIVLAHFFAKKNRIRNVLIGTFSICFYFYCEPKYFILIVLLTLEIYILGLLCEKNKSPIWLIIYVMSAMGILFFFKYAAFFAEIYNTLLNGNLKIITLALPLGISFYTFQSISYIADVYKGLIKAEKNIFNLAVFLTFFPTVASGPLLRYNEFHNELLTREVSLQNISNGLRRFIIGLAKKVIIANQISVIADYSFNCIDGLGWFMAWAGALSYMIQIYFDFSGYSDMALGLGQMFGFHLPENFNYPYESRLITEFWRRWHISLGSWFRNYIYIPLGGNRCSNLRWLINIMTVWIFTGLWHGASLNFVLWGVYFGLILVFEKKWGNQLLKKLPRILQHLIVLLIVLMGWILFRCNNLLDVLAYLCEMINFNKIISLMELKQLDILYLYPVVFFGLILSTSVGKKIYTYFDEKMGLISDVFLIVIFVLSIMILINSTYSPFIYFNF